MLHLFLVVCELGIADDVGLVDETEWTDDGERHLAHLQTRRHGVETSLEHETNRTAVASLFDAMQQLNPEARFSLWRAIESAGKLTEDY